LFLTRPMLGHHVADTHELRTRATDLLGWVAAGELVVRIGERFPLTEAAQAHRRLEGRLTSGKVLLIP
jgi:NADPH2:quinone reductase